MNGHDSMVQSRLQARMTDKIVLSVKLGAESMLVRGLRHRTTYSGATASREGTGNSHDSMVQSRLQARMTDKIVLSVKLGAESMLVRGLRHRTTYSGATASREGTGNNHRNTQVA